MIQLGELHPAGYGMFVYSPDVFVNFLKAEQCRARKLLTYFDLFAYRRAVPLDESMPENYGRNYAFGFAFRRTESAENDNLMKGDNEKTIFDIPWYIESTRAATF